MGMDQNALGVMQQGVDLFGQIQGVMNGQPKTPDYAKQADEQGRLMELNAGDDALDVRRKAKRSAAGLRDERERARSRSTASWGGGNLAMSGSKRLVRDGQRTKDLQDEEDVLFEGEAQAQSALNDGRRRANLFRIQNNADPVRSTLSMGSKIFK